MKGLKKIISVALFFISVNAHAQNIDIDILRGINPQNPNSVVWKDISNSLYGGSAVIIAGTLAYGFINKNKQWQHYGYELLIATGITLVTTDILKIAVDRQRPADAYPGQVFVLSKTVGKSFPSGHASQGFAMATTLTMQYKKWYVAVPAFAWATAVGYSRVYLGKHYPSDVLGGAIVGVASSYLSHIITKKLFTPKKIHTHEKIILTANFY